MMICSRKESTFIQTQKTCHRYAEPLEPSISRGSYALAANSLSSREEEVYRALSRRSKSEILDHMLQDQDEGDGSGFICLECFLVDVPAASVVVFSAICAGRRCSSL